MSVSRLTSTLYIALCLPLLALLAMCAYYAGGIDSVLAAVGVAAIGLQALSYVILSNRVTKPINALAWASSGGVAGLPAGTRLPSEIESIKSYVLSTSTLLDEYREQHKELLMNVPDVLLEIDRDGRIVFVNRAARDMAGYAEDSLLGRPFMDLIAPESREKAQDVFSSLLEGGHVSGVEIKLIFSSGAEKFFEFNAVPLYKDGAVGSYCCIGRDIDERRKIIEELEGAKRHAQEATSKLKKTIADLEEFSLLAVRREIKMQELREMFVRLKETHEINKEFPN